MKSLLSDPWFTFVAVAVLGLVLTAIAGTLSLGCAWVSARISDHYRDRHARRRMRQAARGIVPFDTGRDPVLDELRETSESIQRSVAAIDRLTDDLHRMLSA